MCGAAAKTFALAISKFSSVMICNCCLQCASKQMRNCCLTTLNCWLLGFDYDASSRAHWLTIVFLSSLGDFVSYWVDARLADKTFAQSLLLTAKIRRRWRIVSLCSCFNEIWRVKLMLYTYLKIRVPSLHVFVEWAQNVEKPTKCGCSVLCMRRRIFAVNRFFKMPFNS